MLGLGVQKARLAGFFVPQRQVDVAARSGHLGVPLGQKTGRQVHALGHVFDGHLRQGMGIGQRQGLGVPQVELLLTGAALAHAAFDQHARARQLGAHALHQRLVELGLENLVIGVEVVVRAQVAVALLVPMRVTAREHIKLKLGGALRL